MGAEEGARKKFPPTTHTVFDQKENRGKLGDRLSPFSFFLFCFVESGVNRKRRLPCSDLNTVTDILLEPDDTSKPRPDEYVPGDMLDGRYRVESKLGTGGMGVVYRVTQMFVNKQFALKTLIKEQISEVKIRRFQQEARAVFALDHPNIVAVKDFGIIEDMTPFLVMELIDGETLAERLKRSGRLALEEAIPIFVQTCFGLGYAHDQGIVHRDIKPSNIMILNGIESGAEGSIKILDFGIAKFAQHDGGEIQSLTKTGEVFGSPFYMSPEQCAGERVDYRADVYSLGCVLFEALTGAPPCVGESALSTMMQHQIAKPLSLKEASMGLEFPPELEKIVARMLEKAPEKRYQKLGVVAHHLAALLPATSAGRITGKSVSVISDASDPASHGAKTLDVQRAADAKKSTLSVKSISKPSGSSNSSKAASVVSISMPKLIAIISSIAITSAAVAGMTGYNIGRSQLLEKAKADLKEAEKTKSGTAAGIMRDDRLSSTAQAQATRSSSAHSEDQNTAATPLVAPHPKLAMIPSVAPTPILSTPRQNTVFSFPKDISIGILKVDNQPPKSIVGTQIVGKHSKLTFYTRHASKDRTRLLSTFRDDDLNGLEVVFVHPQEVLDKVKNWKRLEHLCFFDSLVKALPMADNHDQTPVSDDMLPQIDKLKTLTSLGLCGSFVTGRGVAHMSLLNSLHTIMLKRIMDPLPLLKALPQHANIEEVWLIDQGTDNYQLELLTEVPNLQSLTIRRSCLKPDSLPIFLKMKNLKNLTLDRNDWSDEDKAKFLKMIPGCRFEPVFDITYWFLLPDSKINTIRTSLLSTRDGPKKPTSEHDGSAAPKMSKSATLMTTPTTFPGAEDSKNDFGLVDQFLENKGGGKVGLVQFVVRPENLQELGATQSEIAMMSRFPYDLIPKQEHTFVNRLERYLKGPTVWSHR